MKFGEDFTIEPFKKREPRKRGRPPIPPEERKEKIIKIRVNKFIDDALSKLEDKSEFIRNTLQPELEQLDPGPSCIYVQKVVGILQKGIAEATANHDYDEAKALSNVANQLKPFIQLCEIPPGEIKLEDETVKPSLEQKKAVRAAKRGYFTTLQEPLDLIQFVRSIDRTEQLRERFNEILKDLEFIGGN